MRLHFLLLAASLAACGGSSPDAPATPIEDVAVAETSSDDVATIVDTSTTEDAALDATADTAAPIEVGIDATVADSGLAPKPPADATKCASGTFTQADATKVCMEPSSILDSMLGPDGKPKKVDRHCEAATMEGGRWEVWCSPKGIYFWARFECLRATGGWPSSCPGSNHLELGMALYEVASGGGGGGGSLPGVIGTPTYFFSEKDATAIVASGTRDDAKIATSGSGRIFITAHHSATCSGGKVGPPDPDALVTALSMSWPKK